ncbi:MAG: terminase small subunit [Capsulimonadaceae bacterium]|nr:terminase small subunit [Capsulimonadaceae bacterium]
MTDIDELPPLKGKQKAFADAYLGVARFNATKAAQLAGYSGSNATLAQTGSENLRKPDIALYIAARIEAGSMEAKECLARLADIARGDLSEGLDDDGNLNVAKLMQSGNGHLIKSIRRTPNAYGETVSVELYDKQAALVTLAKHLGLLNDRSEVAVSGAVDVNAHSEAEDIELVVKSYKATIIDMLVASGDVLRIENGGRQLAS